ncbi:recombinase family protein [Nocardia sp. NBC_00881]|uniref:recombinase family protein n=1 Tax=Nocardia sp. NBC_00881 TaxID=2975995 RepID=UPI00386FFB7F|nr:recombinase family protein [Nocardia sp. NBC_00881]
MRIGYGRVSTRDQHPEAQHDALTVAGCEQIFIDKASGKLASRPELSKALLVANRPKDQLVVTKIDRLGRSLEHLIELSNALRDRGVDLVVLDQGIDTSTAVGRMFFQILGAIAEFERTRDGLAAARARGRTGGQKPKLGPARSNLPGRFTTNSTNTASAATPSTRSPPSSASPAPLSTGTSTRRPP